MKILYGKEWGANNQTEVCQRKGVESQANADSAPKPMRWGWREEQEIILELMGN